MKKVLITFGDKNFEETRNRFFKEAVEFGQFDKVIGYGTRDLDGEFMAKHGKFISRNPRGYGYWIWKPYLIGRTLATIGEGDLLIYADAGCSINPAGAGRLQDYAARLQTHPSGVLAFELTGMPNFQWTKMDVIGAMNAQAQMAAPMLIGCMSVFRNCEASRELVRQWSRWCERYDLVSDAPSKTPNHPQFEAHRHDQSIFSLLARARQVDVLPDETFGEGSSPILIKRLRPKLGFTEKLNRSFLKRRAALAWRLGLGR